jgi:hypothetical protein
LDVRRLSNGTWTTVYNQEASNLLTAWGLPFDIWDYCADAAYGDPFCVVNSQNPHPAWLLFKYSPAGAWSQWVYLPYAEANNNIVVSQGAPVGAFQCNRVALLVYDARAYWQCVRGAGGPWGSAGASARYSTARDGAAIQALNATGVAYQDGLTSAEYSMIIKLLTDMVNDGKLSQATAKVAMDIASQIRQRTIRG